MAIFCLATSLEDLEERAGQHHRRLHPRADADHARVTSRRQGAMAVLLKDAIKPNLVQTLEDNPAFIHGGPFANIAHGCNTVIATRPALKLGRLRGDRGRLRRRPGCREVHRHQVPQVRAAAAACGDRGHRARARSTTAVSTPRTSSTTNLAAALEKAWPTSSGTCDNIRNRYGLPCVVSINHFTSDTEPETRASAAEDGPARACRWCVARHWSQGSAGAEDLARVVVELAEYGTANDALRLRGRTAHCGTR